MSLQNTADNKNTQKYCKFCKKKVVSSLDCGVCGTSFHPSCGVQAGVADSDNQVTCCKGRDKSEVRSIMDEKQMKSLLEKTFNHHFAPFKNTMEKEISEIKKSMQFLSDIYEEQKTQIRATFDEIKQLKEENCTLKEKVDSMEERLNQIEQREKEKNIVISGIPKQEELLSETIGKVFKALKVPINEGDAQEIFRLNKNEDAPILLKLKNTTIKHELISGMRQMKGLKLNECGLSGGAKNIYFNEDLTRQNQILFKKVRDIKKEKDYHKAYVLNGKVFLKKNENDRPVRIKNEIDIEQL